MTVTVDVDGVDVEFPDEFKSFTPEQQQQAANRAASSPDYKAKKAGANNGGYGREFSDIGSEISKAASSAASSIAAPFVNDPSKQGQLERFLQTGRAAMAVPELAMSPFTGAWRSVVGHGLTDLERLVGENVVGPAMSKLTGREAPPPDPATMYEQSKSDADRSLMALGARGGPLGGAGLADLEAARPPVPQGPPQPRATPLDLSGQPKAPEPPPPAPNTVVSALDRLRQENRPVDMPIAMASDSPVVQGTGQLSSHVPLTGTPMQNAVRKTASDLGGAVESVADDLGSGTGSNVAGRIKDAFSDVAKSEGEQSATDVQAGNEALRAEWERANHDRLQRIQDVEAQARAGTEQQLGSTPPNELGQQTIDATRTADAAAEARKNSLYDNVGEGVIHRDAVGDVRARAAQALDDRGQVIDPQMHPAASAMLRELQKLTDLNITNEAAGAGPATPLGETPQKIGVSLQGLQQVRKKLNFLRSGVEGADGAASNTIMGSFDKWQSDAMEQHLLSGDPNALQTFRAANAANRDWRQRFGYDLEDDADRTLQKIINNQVTPEETANWLLGSGEVGKPGTSSRLFDRLMNITNNDEGLRNSIRGAVYNRLTGANQQTPLAPDKIVENIDRFLNRSGQSFANRIMSPNDQAVLRTYSNTLRAGQEARSMAGDMAKNTEPSAIKPAVGSAQQLAKDVLGNGQRSSEAFYDKLKGMTQSTGRGDIETLARVVQNISPEERGNLGSAMLRELGKSKAMPNEFSPDTFVTNWGKMSDQAKSLLYPDQRRSLDDIAHVSERFKEVSRRFGNPSGTSMATGFRDALGGAAAILLGTHAAPLTALASTVGSYGVAKLLSVPATASSMARWARLYETVSARPTLQGAAAFRQATTNLMNTAQSVKPADKGPTKVFINKSPPP